MISNLYVAVFNSPYYRNAVVPLFIEFERAFSSAVEHRTFNPQVVGSIPTGPTKLEPSFLWACCESQLRSVSMARPSVR